MDERIVRLAKTIVHNSISVKHGDRVYIDVTGEMNDLVEKLAEEVFKCGGTPFVKNISISYLKQLMKYSTPEQIEILLRHELNKMKSMDAYIGIRADENIFELDDIPIDQFQLFTKRYTQSISHAMSNYDRWVLLRYPTYGTAQLASMSFEKCLKIFFQSSTMNYNHFREKVKPLINLLNKTDKVHILSPGTDLSFSIKDIPSFICDGKYNLPDGEVFTAPVKDSINGKITFNIPSSYLSSNYNNVTLTFKEGSIVDFSCTGDKISQLKDLLNTDEGSRRVGEFGIGLNPYIVEPMNSLPFDEKMGGSIHLALGQCYPMAYNGNHSAIHWDIVLCQLEKYGGGEIYFDDILVRKNGIFMIDELIPLN